MHLIYTTTNQRYCHKLFCKRLPYIRYGRSGEFPRPEERVDTTLLEILILRHNRHINSVLENSDFHHSTRVIKIKNHSDSSTQIVLTSPTGYGAFGVRCDLLYNIILHYPLHFGTMVAMSYPKTDPTIVT